MTSPNVWCSICGDVEASTPQIVAYTCQPCLDAELEAKRRWGALARVWVFRNVTPHRFAVGVEGEEERVLLGGGESWKEAFADVGEKDKPGRVPLPPAIYRGPVPSRPSLDALAQREGTDKGPWNDELQRGHGYTPNYEREFARFRDERGVFLEIGVLYGASLRCWSQWFGKKMRIHGLDVQLFPQTRLPMDGRTFFHLCNIRDHELLERIVKGAIGPMPDDGRPAPDRARPLCIVVDDGSHIPADQERAFETLWPYVAPGGLYVIEDLHSSFFPEEVYEGSVFPFLHERIDDCVGRGKWAKWSGLDVGHPQGRELEIVSVRFYRNMVVIEKALGPDPQLAFIARRTRSGALEKKEEKNP